jgi:hypothetical protein
MIYVVLYKLNADPNIVPVIYRKNPSNVKPTGSGLENFAATRRAAVNIL